MLKDRYGRTINYMRVSVTDRCNLRCSYCMPEGIPPLPPAELLTFGEIAFVCAQAAALGIDRFRLTGGEPLVRRDCPALVGMLKAIDGVKQVALTTNGVLLNDHLNALLDAGLDAVNVSLDTLDRQQYRAITGADGLDRVLAAIRAAAGRLPVKINCVIQRGVNEDAPPQLATLARELPVDVRFIELMPMGVCAVFPAERFLAADAVLRAVPALARDGADGVAELYRAPNHRGTVGLIRPLSRCFCADCDRIRVTADGKIKPCLHSADELSLKGLDEAGMKEALRQAILSKPRWHGELSYTERSRAHRNMNQIGG